MDAKKQLRIKVNGDYYELHVEARTTLLDLLRDQLELTGAKKGCGLGQCGACTVLLNGRPVNSCLVLALSAKDKEVLTIEGLAADGALHPLQRAFIDNGAIQCGYCTSGMILSAKALRDENPRPSEGEVREAVSGNLCRCTGYSKIVKSILTASKG